MTVPFRAFRPWVLGITLLTSGYAPPLAAFQFAPSHNNEPSQLPAAVLITHLDFSRGSHGDGRLSIQFNTPDAASSLRNQANGIVLDVSNATLLDSLPRSMNVADFNTPVQHIHIRKYDSGTEFVLDTQSDVQSRAYQEDNKLVVEVTRKRTTDAGEIGSQSSRAVSRTEQNYTGKPVTFNFQDIPIRTVLQLIAAESNLSLVVSDSVQGSITLRLVNVPWDQALDIVLRAKGLAKRVDSNVAWIAPQPELAKFEQSKEDSRIAIENREDLTTEYIQIHYHNAAQISAVLAGAKGVSGSGQGSGSGTASRQDDSFLSPRGRMIADDRTNTLIVSDIPKKLERMRKMIRAIDRPVDQVLIESRIVITTHAFARELGAKFGISGNQNNQYFSGSLDSNDKMIQSPGNAVRGLNWNRPVPVTSNPATFAVSVFNSSSLLDIELSAMQNESRGEVISNPRVLTTNQREALIKQGKEVAYVTITGSGLAGTVPTPNVQFKEAMLELRVTPTIAHDNRVFLAMAMKKDEVEGEIELLNGDKVPVIGRSEVSSAVLVEDGQTVVIGGVYNLSDRHSVGKIPFLGDVPFLGNLFKSRSKKSDKAELLVFVTPKVIRMARTN